MDTGKNSAEVRQEMEHAFSSLKRPGAEKADAIAKHSGGKTQLSDA